MSTNFFEWTPEPANYVEALNAKPVPYEEPNTASKLQSIFTSAAGLLRTYYEVKRDLKAQPIPANPDGTAAGSTPAQSDRPLDTNAPNLRRLFDLSSLKSAMPLILLGGAAIVGIMLLRK